jgi:outer membrane protein
MRTLYTCIFTMAGLLAFGSPAAAQAQKLGYLDSRRILQEAPGTEQVRAQIQQEMSRFQAQVKVLEDSLRKMVTDFEQKSVMLSPEAKRQREQELAQKQNELQQQAARIEQQAGQKQNELMKPVMERVEKAIDDLRKEEGYALILDLAAGAIVSADTTLDVTSKVLTRLKASAGPTASSR